ncbi:hypothetical protein [Nocardia sp. NBC_01329]|uniref:hypothetical protein n=1 Tax=Nocardia sp. NBC_01329 TaxID=2903594 RepID=UPI002E14F50E|nr:hypothetical protein OG405_19265 [Nocardia sp. NBC_01329]
MELAIAELPESAGEDRALASDSGVVVLDGASSHEPGTPPAGRYVDILGSQLVTSLGRADALPEILSGAIRSTVEVLDLRPNSSPSSAVAIVQVRPKTVEVLVLGDTTVVVGFADGRHDVITDNRLNALDIPESSEYRKRLAEGSGYDDIHRGLVGELQRRQRVQRNRIGGYWIAEADPAAAEHAISATYPCESVAWVVVATDGAYDTLEALGVQWPEVAGRSTVGLRALLSRCREWEAETDPAGRILPRAKRHDDKTIAVLRL